jgi:hypothetical protein
MLVSIPVMNLKNQLAFGDKALVFCPAMPALAIEKMLIPIAARLDVVDCDKRLGMHLDTPRGRLTNRAPVATDGADSEGHATVSRRQKATRLTNAQLSVVDRNPLLDGARDVEGARESCD